MKKKILIGSVLAIFIAALAFLLWGSIFTATNYAYAENGAPSTYLVDFETGTVLKESNAENRRPIASMVKIMTLLMAFEALERGEISLEQEVVISQNASSMGGSQMFLEAGDTYKISDLLKGITVVSANDAAVQIAEILARTVEEFVGKMNARAMDLGMENTKFANVTGLPSEEEQYSCAKDVSVMTRELLKHEGYYQYSKNYIEDYTHPDGRVTQFVNTNKLVRFYPGCDAGKTGFTNSAMFCLSASAKKNGLRVVATVVGAETSKARFAAVTEMFNFAFTNYEYRNVLTEDPIENNIIVDGGRTEKIIVKAAQSLSILVKKGENVNCKLNVMIPERVTAPIRVGDAVGKVQLLDSDGNVLKEVDVISMSDVEKANYWDAIKKVLKNWLILRIAA